MMNRRPFAALVAPALFLVLSAGSWGGELRVGGAAVVINPPVGIPLAGYYSPRGAVDIMDDLFAKALVLEKDGVKAALVVCDLISIPRPTVEAARRLIAEQTGIPSTHVMISATHQHTGPVLSRGSARDKMDGGSGDLAVRYTAELPAKIARCVAEAIRRLVPAKVSAGIGREDGISFNRRYWMKDGTVSWNPPKNDPGIIRPAGAIDPDVGVLYFEDLDGRPLVTYVNFAMHPDTTGGTRVSADYPGALARRLADFKGEAMLTIFANGACGNINHLDNRWSAQRSGPAEAKRLGTILAAAVLKTYPQLKPVAAGPLRARSQLVELPLPRVTPEDLAAAREVQKRVSDRKTTFMEKVQAYKVLDVAAREGKPLEAEVQVIALGDQIAWVALPGEAFVELGLSIKKASPFPYTMIAELANGSVGYIPNKSAYPEGNYEVVSARCAEGSGEMLVKAAIEITGQVHFWQDR
jgi:hypothetical protein